jgi:hypothetical protein
MGATNNPVTGGQPKRSRFDHRRSRRGDRFRG